MTFISFIFNFPRHLNNALASLGHKHKVPCEVKNKGYYHHPINNYYMMASFYCKPSAFIKLNNYIILFTLFLFSSPSFLPHIKVIKCPTHQLHFNYIYLL